jgi:hypothetical protein
VGWAGSFSGAQPAHEIPDNPTGSFFTARLTAGFTFRNGRTRKGYLSGAPRLWVAKLALGLILAVEAAMP